MDFYIQFLESRKGAKHNIAFKCSQYMYSIKSARKIDIVWFAAQYPGTWQIFQQKAFLYGMKPRIILRMKGLTNRFEIADKGLKKAPNLKKLPENSNVLFNVLLFLAIFLVIILD